MRINSFRDLDVWKAAVNLAAVTYRATRPFPSDERFGLTAQMRRAAVSVASNIAEGHARNGTREFLHFVSISLGSLAELETQSEIAMRTEIATDVVGSELLTTIGQVRILLLALRTSLIRRANGVSEETPIYASSKTSLLHEPGDSAGPLPPAPCPAVESSTGGTE